MLEGPRPCTILCFNVHTTVEYRNRNASICQLLRHISKSIVVYVQSRPKTRKKHLTKKFARLHNHCPLLTMIWTSVAFCSCAGIACIARENQGRFSFCPKFWFEISGYKRTIFGGTPLFSEFSHSNRPERKLPYHLHKISINLVPKVLSYLNSRARKREDPGNYESTLLSFCAIIALSIHLRFWSTNEIASLERKFSDFPTENLVKWKLPKV